MKQSEYNHILGLINKKEEIETFKAWFNSTSPTTHGMSVSWYIINAQMGSHNQTPMGTANGNANNCPHWNYNNIYANINNELPNRFASLDLELSALETNLAASNKAVNEKRAFEAQIKNQAQQAEKDLKEAISKNQELNLKINTSESEFTNLTQERQTLITDKLNLVSNMNDQQKYFVLTKARDNQNITIEGLILNSGFNEQEYLASQQQEQQPGELEDIFAQQLGINQEIQQEHHEVDVQPTGENIDNISAIPNIP